MKIEIPQVCMVVLIGVSGAGKSTFARKHFLATEIVSSDGCRGLVSDDDNDQSATSDAFDVLYFIAGKRLARNKLVVVDATNVRSEDRARLLRLAKNHDCLAVAIVLDVPAKVAIERNEGRADRSFGARVVRQQRAQLRQGLRGLKRQGFSRAHVLDDLETIAAVEIVRRPLWNDRRQESGPFDIIGDLHGCAQELRTLLVKLGYAIGGPQDAPQVTAPAQRRVIFVGDLIDRGPDSPGVLRLVMSMVQAGTALCVSGNHEAKLLTHLRGKKVKLSHGLAETVAQLEVESEEFVGRVRDFLDGLISHYVLDDGRLVVAHAGLRESYQGRASGRVRSFALYGETSGETDEFGLPVRHDWARAYRGRAMVVYGHTPVLDAEWVNGTICLDTGCVFGGRLTALRYPEREIVEVPAEREWYAPVRPLAARESSERPDDVLDLQDVTGKRIIETRVHHSVTLREENSVAALEVMSRFAVDPRWLIYLPPTMSPSATAPEGEPLLERPLESFDEYARLGIYEVICQEKHMGSRAVMVVARDPETARTRFGVTDGLQGMVYTRTGRPMFGDPSLRAQLVERVAAAMQASGLWSDLQSDWVALDAELMPWSFKARELLRNQYAAVGAAARSACDSAVSTLERASARVPEAAGLLERYRQRRTHVQAYHRSWRRYCWPCPDIDALRFAPFHILASEGSTHFERPHLWHMQTLARLAEHESICVATPHRVVQLDDPESRASATSWWQELTEAGGEGMVIKPRDWLAHGNHGLVQPAMKCRGPEYLRIIYGPEYAAPENLERLRARGLKRKRSLALREYALGLEGLYRFVDGDPLYRVHECVFGVLALESEEVDPRL